MTPPPKTPKGRYAVLGATGLIGSHVVAALKDMPGVSVRAVGGKRAAMEGGNVDSLRANLLDPAEAARALAGCDYAVLAAGIVASAPVLARDPFGPVRDNLAIAINALEAAWKAGVKKCVVVSSTTGYPESDAALTEEMMFQGSPPEKWLALGGAARMLESQCRRYAESAVPPMAVATVRPTLVYGEGDSFDAETAHFLPSLIRRVVARERPLEVWGDGTQARDLVHAADVARAILAAFGHAAPYRAFNVGAGRSYTVNECLAMITELDGFADAEIVHAAERPTSVARRRFDVSRAEAELGFTPAIDLREGVARTLAWYRRQVVGANANSQG